MFFKMAISVKPIVKTSTVRKLSLLMTDVHTYAENPATISVKIDTKIIRVLFDIIFHECYNFKDRKGVFISPSLPSYYLSLGVERISSAFFIISINNIAAVASRILKIVSLICSPPLCIYNNTKPCKSQYILVKYMKF